MDGGSLGEGSVPTDGTGPGDTSTELDGGTSICGDGFHPTGPIDTVVSFCGGGIAGQAFELELYVRDICGCAEHALCDVSVEPGAPAGDFAGTLRLRTEHCVSTELACDCVPIGHIQFGKCQVPALDHGTWRVEVDSQPAGNLRIPQFPDGSEPITHCTTVQPAPPTSHECQDGMPITENLTACVPTEIGANVGFAIEAAFECGACFDLAGQCDVRVDEAARSIRLAPEKRACECAVCGACPEACNRLAISCEVPPLPPGDYTVHIGGESYPLTAVEMGPAEPMCES